MRLQLSILLGLLNQDLVQGALWAHHCLTKAGANATATKMSQSVDIMVMGENPAKKKSAIIRAHSL